MKAVLHWEGKVLVAQLCEMDLSNELLGETLQIIAETQPGDVVLDCSAAPFIASTGIANLIKFIQHVRRSGGRARLAALTPNVQRLLEMVNLRKWVPFYPSISEAIDAAEKSPARPIAAAI